VPPVPRKPADALHSLGAPREVVEWVRKMPPVDAPRTAWIDCPKADWLPYIATLRGFDNGAIVRATCACVLDLTGPPADPTSQRLADILGAGAEQGISALAPVEPTLEDLRLAMLQHGTQPPLPWMPLARLVLELARASRRGNPLIGVALALRVLIDVGGRRANTDLLARFRDKLTLG
jgi:hypothetical protein